MMDRSARAAARSRRSGGPNGDEAHRPPSLRVEARARHPRTSRPGRDRSPFARVRRASRRIPRERVGDPRPTCPPSKGEGRAGPLQWCGPRHRREAPRGISRRHCPRGRAAYGGIRADLEARVTDAQGVEREVGYIGHNAAAPIERVRDSGGCGGRRREERPGERPRSPRGPGSPILGYATAVFSSSSQALFGSNGPLAGCC